MGEVGRRLDADRPSTLVGGRVLQPQVLTETAGDPPPQRQHRRRRGSAVVHPPHDHRRQWRRARGRQDLDRAPFDGGLQTGEVPHVVVHEAVGGRPHLAGLVTDRERSTVDEDQLMPRHGWHRLGAGIEDRSHPSESAVGNGAEWVCTTHVSELVQRRLSYVRGSPHRHRRRRGVVQPLCRGVPAAHGPPRPGRPVALVDPPLTGHSP